MENAAGRFAPPLLGKERELLAVFLLIAVFLLVGLLSLAAIFLLIAVLLLATVVALHEDTSFHMPEYGGILAGTAEIIHRKGKNYG